jgi:hypothetical protein
MADHLPAFDPTDPFDIAAESARRRVCAAMIAIQTSREMAALPPGKALSATLAGSLTGLIGSALAQVSEESRDELMAAIESTMPHARSAAEAMLKALHHG